ncbi:MAG: hypothetical protein JWR07_3121 [Nevskia sp.]|nr:hypothetical protein [Nevskia sp.]
MSKNGLMIGIGGMATAASAHAMFACALMAGQPQPELYLAQIAAPQLQTIQSPQWRLATRRARTDGEMPVTQTLPPVRLHKGLTTC